MTFPIAVLVATAALAYSCGQATPPQPARPTSPPIPTTPMTATPPSQGAIARARHELCDPENTASLHSLSAELDRYDQAGLAPSLSAALQQMEANLLLVSLGPDGLDQRDAAIQALRVLEDEGADAAARSQAAAVASRTVRELVIQLCPAPEM